ncbi:MAG TPA: glycosyltransferase family 4 protein [Acidobacteriaceae bacterium]
MRILMTTDTIGGVWTFTEELARGLLARGCAICLVSIGDPPTQSRLQWCDQMRSQWKDRFRYERIAAPLEWMSNNQDAYDAAASSLLHFAKDFDADLIHSNQFCFGALPLDVPKIVTAHSDVFSWAQACRGETLHPSDWLLRYTALVTRGMTGANSIVAPTYWMANSLAANFPLSNQPSVIPNGRTLPASPISARKYQAVTAGRLWDEAKNISLLARVHCSTPLLIAGESKYDGAAIGPLPDNLTMLGALDPPELFTLFRNSALYICTSRYEPFGLAPLEAALCGCAVLAYDIPSLREVWQEAALYFDSAESLASLISQLESDPHLLAAAQQRSSARAHLFSAERMVDSYYDFFQQALAPREDAAYAA